MTPHEKWILETASKAARSKVTAESYLGRKLLSLNNTIEATGQSAGLSSYQIIGLAVEIWGAK